MFRNENETVVNFIDAIITLWGDQMIEDDINNLRNAQAEAMIDEFVN